jgi:hypothetical protein
VAREDVSNFFRVRESRSDGEIRTKMSIFNAVKETVFRFLLPVFQDAGLYGAVSF